MVFETSSSIVRRKEGGFKTRRSAPVLKEECKCFGGLGELRSERAQCLFGTRRCRRRNASQIFTHPSANPPVSRRSREKRSNGSNLQRTSGNPKERSSVTNRRSHSGEKALLRSGQRSVNRTTSGETLFLSKTVDQLFDAPRFNQGVGSGGQFAKFFPHFFPKIGIGLFDLGFHGGVVFPTLAATADFFLAFADRHGFLLKC